MSLSPGTRLGHYQVSALIGEGGTGLRQRAHALPVAAGLAGHVAMYPDRLSEQLEERFEEFPVQ